MAREIDVGQTWSNQEVEDLLDDGLVGKEQKIYDDVVVALNLIKRRHELVLEVKRFGGSDADVEVFDPKLLARGQLFPSLSLHRTLIPPGCEFTFLPFLATKEVVKGSAVHVQVGMTIAPKNFERSRRQTEFEFENDLSSGACRSSGLASDLRKVLDQPTFSDWTLVCQGKKVPCHRFVLAARSPIFSQLFASAQDQDWTEVSNLDLDTLRDLMEYIYTDSLNTDGDVGKLFSAADEFGISGLKYKCSNILKEKLSCSNAIETLQLAVLHKDDSLKVACFDLMGRHFEAIRFTRSWSDLKSESNFKAIVEDMIGYMSNSMILNQF